MKNIRRVKWIGVIMALAVLLSNKTVVIAQENITSNQYVDSDGQVYEYYLDENSAPYLLSGNEKVYIALPLDFLEVKDADKLEELNSAINCESNSRGVPTNYYDITAFREGNNLLSVIYSMDVKFSTNVTNKKTDVLKINRNHATIVASVSNVSKPIWVLDSDVTLVLYYYEAVEDKWYSAHYIGKDCTTSNFRILFPTSICDYIQFDVRQSSPITSFKFSTWTSGVW